MLRLLLALIALLTALPATAVPACHEAQAPAAHHAAHGQHGPVTPDQPSPPVHECLGCVPPADWLRAPVAAPTLPAAAPPATRQAALLRGRALAPVPPPPRIG